MKDVHGWQNLELNNALWDRGDFNGTTRALEQSWSWCTANRKFYFFVVSTIAIIELPFKIVDHSNK